MKLRELATCGLSIMLVLQMIVAVLPAKVSGQITWSVGLVAGPDDVGFESISLALNSSGGPHVAFHDATGNSLQLARWDGTQWLLETIYAMNDPGPYASLKMDIDGYAHVSYRNANDLAYSNNTSGAWTRQVVDPAANVGVYTSLALKDGKYPCISYFDGTNSALKYASFDGVAWTVTTVDNSASVGQYSSLALDTSGNPHISYYNSTSSDLMHAWWDGTGWQMETVDGVGSVGRYTGMAIDSSNNVHISYANETAPVSLKYAKKSGTVWSFQTVDPGPDVGLHTSIALSPLGLPAISYYDIGNARLMFATTNGITWSTEVVDDQGPTGDVGQFTSLAMSASGNPSIAYWDAMNNDVKYAKGDADHVDLAVAPEDVSFTPSEPFDQGTTVTINATIHNIGNENATSVLVRFYDGTPIPANQIDGDKVIAFILKGGSESVNVTWTAQPIGLHCINTVADPDNTIPELSESNNVAVNCVTVKGPDLLLIPSAISWDPPGNASLSSSVQITANVVNQGLMNASSVKVRFWDGLPGTTQIGTDQLISSIPFGEDRNASVTWTAQPLGGRQICVQSDPANTIIESNETNNDACTAILVTLPDLETQAGDLTATPPGTVSEGVAVTLNLTFRNKGGLPASSYVVSLYDGLPGSGTEILLGNRSGSILQPGASTQETWSWTANSSRPHTFYGVLDGAADMIELNESNNQVNITIFVTTVSDLVTESFIPTPPGPVIAGSLVDLNATWENQGVSTATVEYMMYEDGDGNRIPDIGEDFASWRLTLASGENTSRVSSWSSIVPGFHTLCALADALYEIAEQDELNNQICLTVEVLGEPDLVPSIPLPTPPILMGLGQVIQLSLQVANVGGSAAGSSTLAFYNQSAPSTPFRTFNVPPINGGGASGRFSASWTAPNVTGIFTVYAVVDDGDSVTESDELNNIQYYQINVTDLPQTKILVGSPNYTSLLTYITSATPLTLIANDFSGAGIMRILYRIDLSFWNQYTSPFVLSGDGVHDVDFYSQDNAGNTEPVNTAIYVVDDRAPTTSIMIGSPRYEIGGIWIDHTTPVSLEADDAPTMKSGVNATELRIYDGGNWGPWTIYSSPLTFSTEAAYILEFHSKDNLGNVESANSFSFKVDDTAPSVTPIVSTPRYRESSTDTWNVTPATRISASAVDPGVTTVGLQTLEYSLDGGDWSPVAGAITIPQEGAHSVAFLAADKLGHISSQVDISLVVDGTPPTTSIAIGTPKYSSGNVWVRSETSVIIISTDVGLSPVGAGVTRYRVWGGIWTAWRDYTSPFSLGTPQGQRYIEVEAYDLLMNKETTQNMSLLVDDSPPTGLFSILGPRVSGPVSTTFVSAATNFTVSATDGDAGASGVCKIRYNIDGSPWADFVSQFNLAAMAEGPHILEYNITDNLGNYDTDTLDLILDKAPPVTSLQTSVKPGSGKFWLNASDDRVGLDITYYTIDSGQRQLYTGPVTLQTGNYTIGYYSDDKLGNIETLKSVFVSVPATGGNGGGGVVTPEETNIAPAIGVVLGIILVAVGVALRKRSRKAMATGALLGVVEIMAGISSTFIPDLKIPPWIGMGLIVLLSLFAVGIVAALLLARRGASAQKKIMRAESVEKLETKEKQPPKEIQKVVEEEEPDEMEEPDEAELEEALKSLEDLEE